MTYQHLKHGAVVGSSQKGRRKLVRNSYAHTGLDISDKDTAAINFQRITDDFDDDDVFSQNTLHIDKTPVQSLDMQSYDYYQYSKKHKGIEPFDLNLYKRQKDSREDQDDYLEDDDSDLTYSDVVDQFEEGYQEAVVRKGVFVPFKIFVICVFLALIAGFVVGIIFISLLIGK